MAESKRPSHNDEYPMYRYILAYTHTYTHIHTYILSVQALSNPCSIHMFKLSGSNMPPPKIMGSPTPIMTWGFGQFRTCGLRLAKSVSSKL